MTYTATRDFAAIRAVMTTRENWAAGADDYAGDPAAFEPRRDDGIVYVFVQHGEEFLGLFILAQHSIAEYEIHTRLLAHAKGWRSVESLRGVCAWAFAGGVPGCRRIVGAVPETNLLAIRFAERAGFEQYGFNPASYAKGGKLIGQVLLGISPATSQDGR